MTRTIEQLAELAGVEINESKPTDLSLLKQKLVGLMKINNMKAVSSLMKDFMKSNPNEFNKAMDYLVSLK